MVKSRPATWRNIIIFIAGVLLVGNVAGYNFQAVYGLGGLLFILSPGLIALGLRAFGGDGWGDTGFHLGIGAHRGLYLGALVLFPAIFAVTLVLGQMLGMVDMQPNWSDALMVAALTGAFPILIYAFSEEVAWRGYLEPRMAALGVPALKRHLIVASVWGAWHTGYVLSQTDYTTLPLPLFFLLFFASMIPMSILYGTWRAQTDSFWPAFLMHGIANILAWPLLKPEIVVIDNPLLFAASPDGLVVLVLLWLAALVVLIRAR